MILSEILASELKIFSYSCLLGSGLGALYDFFRIIRMMINPHSIAIFIQDVLYFIASGLITFLFVLGLNRGETRFYILAGEGIGWIIYHISIGEIVYKCSGRVAKRFKCKFEVFVRKIKAKIKA